MQNFKLLLAALAVGGAVSSCSDSTDVNNGGDKAQWNADGTGYISLAINLPTQNSNGTRADVGSTNNDQFDDGEASEYRVKDATLLLFSGSDEATATFAGAYNLDLNWNTNSTTNNITSTAKIVRKINQTEGTLWALVVLNGKATGIYSCTTNTTGRDEKDATPKIGTVTLTEGKFGTKLSDLQNATVTKKTNFLNNSYFFMTNAPLATAPSAATGFSAGKVQTLATVTASAVYSTEQAANNGDPAATINVERSMAKVNVATDPTATMKLVFTSNVDYQEKQIDCKVTAWALDNTNQQSYIVRNTQTTEFDAWKDLRSKASAVEGMNTGYRFQGANAVVNDKFYRTYWAIDPNYSGTSLSADDLETVTTLSTEVDKPQYCFENTFDVANQKQNQTTRAIIEVQYGNQTTATDYYAYSNQTATLQNGTSFFNTMKDLLKTTPEYATKAAGTTIDDSKLTVEATEIPTKKGYVTLTVKYDGTEWTDCSEALNTLRPNIAKYTNGKAYYSVLIKHFGDDLTPWNGSDTKKEWMDGHQPKAGNYISTIYPNATDNRQDANYLGRYGVLRNNWYNINVKGVEKIGSPVIPEDNDYPDDEIETYLKVEINILAWAKRTQDTVLK